LVFVVGIFDQIPDGSVMVNTTSRSVTQWSTGLSPFHLGPVPLYGGHVSQNVENGWQYSKTYKCHVDSKNDPTPEYFEWARAGWENTRAVRYPMGKGAKPEYSYWDGQKLGYIEARKKIYLPLYMTAVVESEAYRTLKNIYAKNDIYLRDFDGYNHRKLGMTYEQVLNNPNKTMGHAFVLAMMLELGKEIKDLL